MALPPTQTVLTGTLLLAIAIVWYAAGRDRWRSVAADRFVYGVPWGTLLTVTIVVAFYVLIQSNGRHLSDPVILPYITWSYWYPAGLLTAGIAHASSAHIGSNMAATLAFAPIAEYAWSHYPPSARADRRRRGELPGTGGATDGGLLTRPWIRALVVFPAALLGVALLTAILGLGPGLGFSGAVFAIVGFAVVTYPVASILGTVVASAFQTLFLALSQPIVRATLDPGPPGPPAWAGIGFQAHLLGFLLGALCAIALLRARDRQPTVERVFFATVVVGLVQSLWLLVWIGDDVFVLYRGAGVTLVIGVALLVAAAVAGPTYRLFQPRTPDSRLPTRRQLAIGWLALLAAGVVIGTAAAVVAGEFHPAVVAGLSLVTATLLSIPAIPTAVPDRWYEGPMTHRDVAVVALVLMTVVVALPSIPLNLFVVGEGTVPGSGGVETGGYTVTYEQNATNGQEPIVDPGFDDDGDPLQNQVDGLIVVNDDREIWTTAERQAVIEHDGEATVHLGGVGWREAVHAERSGWEVAGNESSYAVDLTVDDETTRSFASEPVRASATIDSRAIEVEPTADAFAVRVVDGDVIGEREIPAVNETTSIGDIEFVTERVDLGDDGDDDEELVRVLASADDTEVLVAERETYAD